MAKSKSKPVKKAAKKMAKKVAKKAVKAVKKMVKKAAPKKKTAAKKTGSAKNTRAKSTGRSMSGKMSGGNSGRGAAKKAAPKKAAKKESKSTGIVGSVKKAIENALAPAKKTVTELKDLFEDELKDIYWAEKALVKALPKMMKKTDSADLKNAIQEHLRVTEGQVTRLERVFQTLNMAPKAKKCEAMAGLIEEAEELMDETASGPVRDAAIISCAQKVEHYEIATYGTLRTFARTLGLTQAAQLLEQTLEEEKEADVNLTKIAEGKINENAIENEDNKSAATGPKAEAKMTGEDDEEEEEDEDEDEEDDDEDEEDDDEEDEEDDDKTEDKGRDSMAKDFSFFR